MRRVDVAAWVAEYERAWRDQDVSGVERLFTPGAHYLRSAYDDGLRGLDEIREFWPDDTPFRMTWEVVAVQDPTAVVRAEVHYLGPEPHEYRDLWILRFAEDGRVAHFEEWAHWPGMPGWDPSAS
jgi:hypothetical protein